jgi:ABC-type glycerol-3-phosphate transport system substrate-binding protein
VAICWTRRSKASAVKQPATLDAFTWLEDLFQKQGISPDAATASSLGGAAGMFTSGASAMLPVGFWQIAGTVNKVTDFAWKTLPIPVERGWTRQRLRGERQPHLFTSSKNPDAAWAYMQTWMQDEFLLSLVQIGFNPSSKPAVNTHASLQSLPYYDAVKVTVEQLASNKFGTVPTPADQLQSEVLTAGNTAVSSLWQRKASVRDVLETLDQAVRETLSKPIPGA